MRRYLYPLLMMAAAGMMVGCREDPLPERVHTLALGDDSVAVVVHTEGRPGFRYLILHDNENTAVEASLATVRKFGGAVVELRHSGERNVRFTREGRIYEFDPNRAFTPDGAMQSVAQFTSDPIDTAVVDVVREFADSLLALARPEEGGPIVTVHNNTGDEYTVLSYYADGDLALEAQFVHIAPDEDTDDFVFTTDADIYRWAREAGFNAVQQRMPPMTDDGSLSVWAAKNRVPYVNFEAEHGHFESQLRMLTLWARRDGGP